MIRSLIRLAYGIDVFEAVAAAERGRDAMRRELTASFAAENAAEDRARRFWRERDEARDRAASLSAELHSVQKTNALLRSLVAILREANQGLDERIIHLEKLRGVQGPVAATASEPNGR